MSELARTGPRPVQLPGVGVAALPQEQLRSAPCVSKAIRRAHQTIKHLCWFQVVETRGSIIKVNVHQWYVTLKVGFAVEA